MTMYRSLLLAGLLLGGAAPLAAQPAPPAAEPARTPAASPASTPAGTLLVLSETAELRRAPDEIRAELRFEARAGNAAAAQAAVNTAMQRALATARAVTGVTASTGGYWTGRNDENRQWTASQGLQLRGQDPAALLELTGTLQEQRLALTELSWQLSTPQQQAARQEAERLAIAALRARAEAVAGQLGMKVAAIRRLQLGEAERPQPRMLAMARAAAPAPVAVPEDVIVTGTATAQVLLQP